MDLIYSKPKSLSTLEAQLRAYSDLSEQNAQRLASETFNGGPTVPPPITPREDWPHMDEQQMRLAEYRIKRLEQAINLAYPLLAGETLDSDGVFTSFLSSDFLDYPAGTVALRRRSSLASSSSSTPSSPSAKGSSLTARQRCRSNSLQEPVPAFLPGAPSPPRSGSLC